ncbi:5fef2285-2abb-49d2-9a44-8740aab37832 [Thermothielavioides terrestris]|uniref:5fef2285-2abb-49d2-9a44-8740aab37832 n=1 Tax=Thermothielavioides terrestris TaxID=2587410 RepID=A0A3S4D0K5_9PEZI|nr:5fef2285-2abb-49d2-9a44-8740aab37832 [Thermothielavioides terrestris]
MATRNAYLAYKRDTSRLLYWIIQTSNAIIRSSQARGPDEDVPAVANTTGEITVSSLVFLSKLIAKHIGAVPPAIYRLFQSVIDARTASYVIFQKLAAQNPNPEMERSNASHKAFIDALVEAFEALGGKEWKMADGPADDGSDLKREDLDQLLLTNRFSALDLEGQTAASGHGDDASDEESDKTEPQAASASKRRRQPKPGKGKKGKRGKKAKKQQAPALDDVPLESYRIIQGKDGISADYLIAVDALVREWTELRSYLQGVWREVAYNGLNSAVAGAVSTLAVAMIQRSAAAMFIDFPGLDSFEAVVNAITRGDLEKAKGYSALSPGPRDGDDGLEDAKAGEAEVDVKEHFLLHAYQDLVDFLADFQKNRNGKPTKRMLDEIGDWNPELNLREASKEERLRWRRAYTINWLYDLVNVHSSMVAQRNNTSAREGEREAREDMECYGQPDPHPRIFGLNQFASAISSLARRKNGTDSPSADQGPVLAPPAPDFHPRRDVDIFLDPKYERFGRGFLRAVNVLWKSFERDAEELGDKERNKHKHLLWWIEHDIGVGLGELKYLRLWLSIPPSRLSDTRPNGLWEYSPFLCGVGLMEALELAYRVSMVIWDRIPEQMSLVHLHNMLVQTGRLKKPVEIFASISTLFQSAFFLDGKIPTTGFGKALTTLYDKTGRYRATLARANRRADARSGGVHRTLSPDTNRFIQRKSNLLLYRQADWNVDRIPDADVPVRSMLGRVRLSQTKQTVDPTTGAARLEETDLVRRARAQGASDQELLSMAASIGQILQRLPGGAGRGAHLSSDHLANKRTTEARAAGRGGGGELSGRDLLALLREDIFRDVCGSGGGSGEGEGGGEGADDGVPPLSSINYLWVTVEGLLMFIMMEEELASRQNKVYLRSYEESGERLAGKRQWLTLEALHDMEDECLSVMAAVFEDVSGEFGHRSYWADVEPDAATRLTGPNPSPRFKYLEAGV